MKQPLWIIEWCCFVTSSVLLWLLSKYKFIKKKRFDFVVYTAQRERHQHNTFIQVEQWQQGLWWNCYWLQLLNVLLLNFVLFSPYFRNQRRVRGFMFGFFFLYLKLSCWTNKEAKMSSPSAGKRRMDTDVMKLYDEFHPKINNFLIRLLTLQDWEQTWSDDFGRAERVLREVFWPDWK